MSLFGGPTPFANAFKSLPAGSLRYNTSQAGTVLPICYGTQRLSINLLELWGETGGPGKSAKGGGGGGGGKGKKGSSDYQVDVAMAICQGPLPDAFTGASDEEGGYNDAWSNGGQVPFNGTGLNGYDGDDGQAPDPVFEASDPNQPVIGYSGTVYVTGTPMDLGQSPVLPNISFQISGFLYGSIGSDLPNDANPSYIIQDMLSDPRYGAGFPAANIDGTGYPPAGSTTSFDQFAAYCQASGLGMSILMDRPQPAAHWLDYIAQHTVAAVVWSGALLKIIPYATGAISGNGAVWTPDLTPVYALDDDDFVPWEGEAGGGGGGGGQSDPVQLTRSDPSAATNWLSLEYYDWTNSYNPNIAPVWDQGAIDEFGVRTEPSIEAHCFTAMTIAAASAQLQLNRKQAVRNTAKFQLPWVFMLLEPGDIVSLTDTGLGLAGAPYRITSIDETENGELSIEAEELPGVAWGMSPQYPVQNTAGAPLDLYAAPGNVNPPVVFEPPAALTGGVNEVRFAASGGAEWGGCVVQASLDGDTYKPIGTIYGAAIQGVLTAALPNYLGANPDSGDTLAIDLTESGGALISASAANAAANVSLCYVDGELLSYETATLVSADKYDLTTLYRAAFGSAVGAHASGSQFAYLGLTGGEGQLSYSYPASLVGQTIYLKFQSFNKFGNELQDLADLSPYSRVLSGSGTNPLANPILAALAAGTAANWGTVGTTLIGTANLGSVADAIGASINLGTLA